MKTLRSILTLTAATAVLIGCTSTETRTSSVKVNTPTSIALADIGYSVANPIQQGNVQLIPIVSNNSDKVEQDVITLAVAKQNGWVEITESESVDYNAVHVVNNGPKPLLLIAGDLVLGGHQDRVVAHDTIIDPGKSMDVEVFCVEEGRGTGPTDVFLPSDQPVPHKVRREAVFAKNQQRVWSAVGGFNASASAAPATSTVQGGLEKQEVVSHVRTNAKPITEKLLQVPNAVGYVLVIDGRIDTAEVFGSNALFKMAAPSLVKSVMAQQATSITTQSTNMSASKVESFLVDAMTGRRDKESVASNGVDSMPSLRSDTMRSTVRPSPTPYARDYFAVEGKSNSVGFEIYQPKSAGGAKGKKLLHGTYANK